jgi:hypothetical protein
VTELDEIRRQYDSGQLDLIRDDLERFISANRERILAYHRQQCARGLPLDLDTSVKFFILQVKSINAQKEIRDQLDEIRRETWIRGVADGQEPDPQAVAADWARRHSAFWREHRVTTIIYVFEKDRARYAKLLV